MRRILVLMSVLVLFACGDEYVPKPVGYFRIGLPEKEYVTLDSTGCNFSLNLNKSAEFKMVPDKDCWANVEYPSLKATIQLTYYNIHEKDFESLIREGQRMAYSHTARADGLQEKFFANDEKRVYGICYRMVGPVATSTQFYMTDSTDHFLRGVLYFYSSPNPDSLKNVNEFMQGEVIELIESLKWKNG